MLELKATDLRTSGLLGRDSEGTGILKGIQHEDDICFAFIHQTGKSRHPEVQTKTCVLL